MRVFLADVDTRFNNVLLTSLASNASITTVDNDVLCFVELDFPPIFDRRGVPVNYNDYVVISSVDGKAIFGTITKVYYDPVLNDPDGPRIGT